MDRAECFEHLDGPVTRLAGPEVPGVPFHHVLEDWFMLDPRRWSTRPARWPPTEPMIDHDLHHGGEIGALRDLYRERTMTTDRVPAHANLGTRDELTTIKMPQLGESVTEGTIERWLVKEGDTVEQYDPLFEVVTDKVNAEVPAEVAGTITKIMVPDGETVKVGTPLAEISGDGAGRGSGGRGPGRVVRTGRSGARWQPAAGTRARAGRRGRARRRRPHPSPRPRPPSRRHRPPRPKRGRRSRSCRSRSGRGAAAPATDGSIRDDPGRSPPGPRARHRHQPAEGQRRRRTRHPRGRARVRGGWRSRQRPPPEPPAPAARRRRRPDAG